MSSTPSISDAVMLTLLAVLVANRPVLGQSALTLEIGASQIGTALDASGNDARFAIAGLRGSRYATNGTGVFGSVLAGHVLDAGNGGSFLSGMLEARLADRWSSSLDASFEARLLGYGVEDPFPYRAFAVEGGPSLRYQRPELSVELSGLLGAGHSEIELWRVEGGATRRFANELWRGGGTLEVLLGPVNSQFGLVGGWHRTPSGDYRSVGARTVFAGAWGIADLRADRWVTPFSTDIVAGLTLVVPIGSVWSVRGFFGRTDPDPLTLAQPGAASGGVLIGRSLLGSSDRAERSPIYRVARSGDAAARVYFSIGAPDDARVVQVLGDFSLWEPIPMERDGSEWNVNVDVPVGTHHFGFLVDDEWYLPDDAPDVVPDEWGRLSATLVIEGGS